MPRSYLVKQGKSQYRLRGVADIIYRDEGFIVECLEPRGQIDNIIDKGLVFKPKG